MARTAQAQLNRMSPAANKARLGDVVVELINQVNSLSAKFNATLAKMDTDAGVTGTDYVATQAVSATAIVGIELRDV